MEIATIDSWGIFPQTRPCLIAGPCSAESQDQLLQTASALRKEGVGVLRAGLWKPRTHPDSFEGVGKEGLPWMQQVQRELGMKVCTEVAGARHVESCLEAGLDMLWIGARTTANPFLVQEIADALAGSDIPVLVKNPVNPDLSLWIGALERLSRSGIRRLGAVHRGFTPSSKSFYRNDPLWQLPIQLRSRFPELPFFCDPSHLTGDSRYIKEVCQLAMDLGLEGLMIEAHCNPCEALSDASQQLAPQELGMLLGSLTVRQADCDSREYHESISQLRARIDIADEALISALAARMEASREIGRYKKDNNIAILQTSRWEEVLARVVSKGKEYGLDGDFISELFNLVHKESVQMQNGVMEGKTGGQR